MADLILKLSETGWKAVTAFANFFIYLYNTTVFEFVETITKTEILGPFFGWIADVNFHMILSALGIADMSVLMFIAVDGLIIVAVLQFIKWILGFVF